ncbi:hypothetical protein CAEBREN_10432 [Caenorhabditis brenneri]|uniref:BTB domain-containing protein n=1 Tax=Caenorhabditis brenneri TaxID=135651 RepID=G0MCS4_CAEBE|nr:hypothetical protein CAEBREN_10432 [Caenorhabditis brenneri]
MPPKKTAQQKINEKIQKEMEVIRKELQEIKENQGAEGRKRDGDPPENPAAKRTVPEEQTPIPLAKRVFRKITLKNVSIMREGDIIHNPGENHFDTVWNFSVCRKNDYLGVATGMSSNSHLVVADLKMIICDISVKTTLTTDKDTWISARFLKWDEVRGICNEHGALVIEAEVVFTKMEDTRKQILRNFDSSMAKFSDVTLVVQNQKFYVSKLFLAAQSTYFEALFLNGFRESEQSEIQLHGLDPNDFQNYLEALYGHSAINLEKLDKKVLKELLRKCDVVVLD